MALLIADTDVLIDFLSGHAPAGGTVERALADGKLTTTCITHFELLSGARTQRQKKSIGDLLAGIGILILDELAAARAARIRIELEKEGRTIGMADYAIAGIVLEKKGVLLTRNRKHFERVPDLRLGDS